MAKLVFSAHAVGRMFQHAISVDDVKHVLAKGRTIETYDDDQPYPSRLILGRAGSRPLHVVVADNKDEDCMVVVTAYEPDQGLWDEGFERRKPT